MRTDDWLDIARETIARRRFCVAVTVTPHGEANARVVQPHPPTEDWTVDFATRRSCRKVRDLLATGTLTLVWQDDEQRAYVSLSGAGSLDDDLELKRARWAALSPAERELALRWNPGGPDDRDLLYVRLQTTRIELWNAARGVMPEPPGYSAAVLRRTDVDGEWQASTT